MVSSSSAPNTLPSVAVVMGSTSDWETLQHSAELLHQLNIAYGCAIVSAHRTPDRMAHFAKQAQALGVRVIIAGAGGAAHLPGMIAAHTPLPVLGVPVQTQSLNGMDSLLSIVQMPGGVPVGTMAIGTAGAKNAALLAASILALNDTPLAERLNQFRGQQSLNALATPPTDERFQPLAL